MLDKHKESIEQEDENIPEQELNEGDELEDELNLEYIADEEMLYRKVPDSPTMWSEKHQRFSSAVFKDSGGASVDRGGKRSDDEMIKQFQGRFGNIRAILAISAGKCRELDTHPVPKPEQDNKYHAEIHQSSTNAILKGKAPSNLQQNSRIVFDSKSGG